MVPLLSTATFVGQLKRAAPFAPSAKPAYPLPATVLTVLTLLTFPAIVNHRIASLPEEAVH